MGGKKENRFKIKGTIKNNGNFRHMAQVITTQHLSLSGKRVIEKRKPLDKSLCFVVFQKSFKIKEQTS